MLSSSKPTPSPAGEFSAQQQAWLRSAVAEIDAAALRGLAMEMTAIPSPTGAERPLAEYLVQRLGSRGFEAAYQRIDDDQGNATARYRGDRSGPSLMLFAPIDTHITGDAADDGAWPGLSDARADLRPQPFAEAGSVVGLGAENPKGHAACVVAAAEAVRRAGIPLRGDLLVGLAAGGMPVSRSPLARITRTNVGQGNGCSFMLERGFRSDFAVIAKPGQAVAYEEVGLCWFKLTVKGTFDYAGRGRHATHRNPIVDAAKVIAGLENWFPEYTVANTSGLVAPQGSVGAIEGGWPEKPSFIPAACNIYLDMRISPRVEPAAVHQQLDHALDRIRAANPGVDVSSEMILAIPGGTTPPDNWIIRSTVKAWESVAQQTHQPQTHTSGATDANILRGRGIPTARVGMPPGAQIERFKGLFSMGVVSESNMVALTRCLVTIVIDTCTRTYADVGLPHADGTTNGN
jgi:acetylornithine deacetylase/succinyl-diaminopimelate desuccinylase-like protein